MYRQMEAYYKAASEGTPYILLHPEENIFEISGMLLESGTSVIYEIEQWLIKYGKGLPADITFTFRLEQYKHKVARELFTLLYEIKKLKGAKVIWYTYPKAYGGRTMPVPPNLKTFEKEFLVLKPVDEDSQAEKINQLVHTKDETNILLALQLAKSQGMAEEPFLYKALINRWLSIPVNELFKKGYFLTLTYRNSLRLSHCRIKSIPSHIKKLPHLASFDLSNNPVKVIPPVIGELKNLKYLNLSDTLISNLPAEIGKLQELETLILSSSLIKELPPEIGQLKNLHSLDLSNTPITHLPKEIGQLKNLKIVNLSDSSVNKLPPEIRGLKNLHTLDLSNAPINELPPETGQLKNLTDFILANVPIQKLPEEVAQLKKLKKLFLSNTSIISLPADIGNMKSLQELNLTNALVTKLPTSIGQLKKLNLLILRGCPIKEVAPEIVQLPSLHFFTPSAAQLKHIDIAVLKKASQSLQLFVDTHLETTLPKELIKHKKTKILQPLYITGDTYNDVPEIILDMATRTFSIVGRSLPEEAVEFYQPIVDWLDLYAKTPHSTTRLVCKLGYFSTASSSMLLWAFSKLEGIHGAEVHWYFHQNDEDMEEAGTEFSELVDVPFKLLTY